MTTLYEYISLTPAQAAKRAGVSRPTINRALKSRDLPGRRDNQNRWQISPEDLDAWKESRRSDQFVTTGHDHLAITLNDQLQAAEVRAVRAEVERDAAMARAEAAEADRDRWHETYKAATQKSDPLLTTAFAVLFGASIATLTSGLPVKDPLQWAATFFLGGGLLVISLTIGHRIRGQLKSKDKNK